MVENDSQKTESQFGKIEQILRERERLDEMIQEKFQKKMTVFFSDVCGFTQYLDKWGDIKGRFWIQKYHDIVLPTIKKNGGEVLDLIGDGLFRNRHAPQRGSVPACPPRKNGRQTQAASAGGSLVLARRPVEGQDPITDRQRHGMGAGTGVKPGPDLLHVPGDRVG